MIEFKVHTNSEDADNLSTQLSLLGADVVTWQDAQNQPIYEPNPEQVILWDKVTVSAIFSDVSLTESISRYLTNLQYQFQVQDVVQQDWVRKTQALFAPLQFGDRLWICPTWHEVPDPNAVNVKFDPGVAFGTGTHPTTALCLEWLDQHIKGNESIIDYGCGSGILAISALKLGAREALAVDHDPQALEASMLNAEINQVDAELTVALPQHAPAKQADILIANIISKPLIELASTFTKLIKVNGQLVLSGLLENQINEVMQAYQNDFEFVKPYTVKDGWVRLTALRTK